MSKKTITELEGRIEDLEALLEARDREHERIQASLVQECQLRAERIVALDRENQALKQRSSS